MIGRTFIAAIAIAVVCSADVAQARVTRIEILKVEPVAPGGRAVASAGPYERIAGKAHGELDPNDPRNALITDIKLAPRNARGKVEYIATFSLMKPIDMTHSSGVLMYSVVNRGNGAAAAGPDGHVSLVSGWQGDVLPTATNQTIQVPVAKNPDGTSVSGPLVLRFTGLTGTTTTLMIPRNQPSPYPPVTLDTTKSSLVSAVSESATGVKSGTVVIPASDWAFADCATTAFPGKPDATRICVKNGFNPALLYELQYAARDPLVLGIGVAASTRCSITTWDHTLITGISPGFLTQPPTVKQSLPQLVVKVDADGNEIAGLKSPLQMAPLGTYTGWNVMSSGPFKGQMCLFASPVGGFITFAKTKDERLASRDPRLSLEERYQTHDGYVQALGAAARSLVKSGYLRQGDADTMIKQAEESSVLR